jgi:glyoxylase-like metal-dependent hydrolase (beta-lactamase superfamily II)
VRVSKTPQQILLVEYKYSADEGHLLGTVTFPFVRLASLTNQNESPIIEVTKYLQSIFVQPITCLPDSLIFLGVRSAPPFGIGWPKYEVVTYLWKAESETDEFTSSFKSAVASDPLWLTPKQILQMFYNNQLQLVPEVKQIVHNMSVSRNDEEFIELCREQTKNEVTGLQTKLEYSPYIECIPIASDTLSPFTTTNSVIITSREHVILVDPGASEKGRWHLLSILNALRESQGSFLCSVDIFVTHKHRDHIASIDVVADIFPHSKIFGHPQTLKHITSSLEKIPIDISTNEFYEIKLSSLTVQVMYLPGHTDGHMALWIPTSRTLIAGDHVVGWGSAVLDPDSGGDMSAYLESTKRLLQLNPKLVIPAHGGICRTPIQLLQQYIEHRLQREKEVLTAWQNGHKTINAIVAVVYKQLEPKLIPFAKMNAYLHLVKLQKDGLIDKDIDFKQQLKISA